MWKPDGAGTRAKIGVLTPHLDPVPESELRAMAPPGVSVHAARVPLGMVGADGRVVPRIGPDVARAFAEPPAVDHAVSLLSPLQLDAIVYAFTSSSYILGPQQDRRLKARLEERSSGATLVIQTPALVSALAALSARAIALVHPPWFTPELDARGADYFRQQGLEVVQHGPAALRRDYGDILPEQVFLWARAHVPDQADALVFGGGGFRVVGVIDALEAELGRPVVGANQAALWCALRAAGIDERIEGYGRLFEKH